MPADLFPLRLTPFEYYYWCDDRPDYPTVFPLELVFSPALDRGPLEQALAVVIERYPLLGSLIAEDRRRGPCWVGGAPPIVVDWAGQEVPISHVDGPRIDLHRAAGLRIWARAGPDRTRLVLQFHHACCDGIGALRLVEDWLTAYARECGDRAAANLALAPREPAELRYRGDLDLPDRSLGAVLRDWWVGARIWSTFAMQSPTPLAGAGTGTADSFLAFTSQSLDPELGVRLRQAATQARCTVNDILLCGLFLAVRAWNEQRGQPDGLFRINLPVRIRDRGDARLPSTNSLTFTFLTREARACDTWQGLLQGICRETAAIKRYQLGLYFVGGLAVLGRVPGLLPWFLRRPTCRATAVLSNVGRVFPRTRLPRRAGQIVCGGAVLRSVAGVPPLRPLTRAAIVVLTYAGRTSIHLRCDPHCFDRAAQDEFLTAYIEQLTRM
ncbi:MAG: hypothetical protein A2W31_08020 [Planctomycetes bacterium RBG_16_64_10]|nr:MAG: hypothetical protein A2W31_08020 [Planctomycetes bacterium RBG_16_64_10]